MKSSPVLSQPPTHQPAKVDEVKLSPPTNNTSSNPAPDENLPKPTDEEIAAHFGLPTGDLKSQFDETQRRIEAKRAKYYNDAQTPLSIISLPEEKISPGGKEYLERMKGGSKAKPGPLTLDQILARIRNETPAQRPMMMPVEDGLCIMDALYEQALSPRQRAAYWTPERVEVAEGVLRYFIGDPDGPYPLHKGLFLYGPVGVGKTFLMGIMQKLCQYANLHNMAFDIVATKNLMLAIEVAKTQSPLYAMYKGIWMLDDLGEEDAATNLWGKEKTPMDSLLSTRYEKFVSDGLLTHFSSNYLPEELAELYGSRIGDRFNEWTTFILVPGESMRDDEIGKPETETES